jgi:hypothetical protein
MPTPHIVDDRELMRFWLQQRSEQQGFKVAKLAKTLNISPGAVRHWIRGRNSVHPKYWTTIGQFFGYPQPERMFDEARASMAAFAP